MMLTNAEIKSIRALREKKFRDAEGLFVVEGEKMVAEALASSFEVVRVLRVEDIGASAMERISLCATPSPVLAVVRMPLESVPDRIPGGLTLALDSVRDPGNFGTILRIADWFGVSQVFASPDSVETFNPKTVQASLRIADWFGVSQVFASPDSVETFNPKTVQASMGSVFRVRVSRCDIAALCAEFSSAGRRVYGTVLDGENIYSAQLAADGLVVMGNESNGISAEVARLLDSRLRIPSFGGGAESLNVAVATAVTLSEFRRR